MKIVMEIRQEEENRSKEFSRLSKLKQGVCIDKGEKMFWRPFQLSSRVGNSCFSSKDIESSWTQIVV